MAKENISDENAWKRSFINKIYATVNIEIKLKSSSSKLAEVKKVLIKSVDVLKRVHSWSALDGVRSDILFSNRRFRIELDYVKLKLFLEIKSKIKLKIII